MKRKVTSLVLVVLCATVALSAAAAEPGRRAAAPSQSGGSYDLTWNAVAGGGAMFSTGGGYSLGGTMGQAGAEGMSGGGYSLTGGFWTGATSPYAVYLPLVMK